MTKDELIRLLDDVIVSLERIEEDTGSDERSAISISLFYAKVAHRIMSEDWDKKMPDGKSG
jgi:hypothetical protein